MVLRNINVSGAVIVNGKGSELMIHASHAQWMIAGTAMGSTSAIAAPLLFYHHYKLQRVS